MTPWCSGQQFCDSPCQLSPIEKTYCRHADYNFRVVSKKTSPLYDKTRFCVHYLLVSVFECCLKIAFNFGLCFLLLQKQSLSTKCECVTETFFKVNYCRVFFDRNGYYDRFQPCNQNHQIAKIDNQFQITIKSTRFGS